VGTRTEGPSDRLPRYDRAYKRLFTQPELVEELLRGFLREDWAAGLDFSTLEPVSGSFVGRGLEERHGDLIWRLRWRDGEEERWFYLYVLLEFQSSPDHFMAVRFLSYIGLLLQRIIQMEKLKRGDLLPAILPVVAYRGKRPWGAPLDLSELFVPVPPGLRRFLPRLTYVLLDENRLDLDQPHLERNRVAALFRLETQGTPGNAPFLMEEVASLISPKEEPELWAVVEVWIRAVLRRICPDGIMTPERVTPEDFLMIYDNFRKWFADARKEGRAEGRQEGRKEGFQEGRKEEQVETLQRIILRLLSKRFGPLPPPVSQKVERISSARKLQTLLDRALEVDSLQELGIR
jgi:predicted transposase YdaD